ncbi:MAG: protein translocase subunit SecF [Oscillospiraceae bacterium]|nr:protein translocase subunit SecF [Oscillospiraceae bacterium]
MANRKKFFIFSAVLVIFSILSTFIFGAKLDIQFKGGTLITYLYDGSIDTNQFKTDAETALGGLSVNITTGTDFNTGKNNITVSLLSNSGLTADKQIELTNTLEEKYAENNITLLESTDVSPSAGSEFFKKCLVAAALAAVVLILYIAVRFKNIGGWLAGICAIIALFHDIIIVYGSFVVLHMDIDANFMAVILTILGYSVNDTIVIYDRIRENKGLYKNSFSLSDLVDFSTNQSFVRSINTSVTTIAAMIVVSVVAVMRGVDSIISFSVPMTIGLIIGTYSSLCIAAPLWVYLEERKGKKTGNEPAKA